MVRDEWSAPQAEPKKSPQFTLDMKQVWMLEKKNVCASAGS
jgi:hypothetical protein